MSRSKSNRTNIKTTDSNNSNIALTKALQNITKNQTGFDKSVLDLSSLISETFGELELKINARQKELSDLDEKFTHSEKQKKLEVDLNVKEHGYQAALQFLENRDEIAVSKHHYDELKQTYENLKQTKDIDVKEAVSREQKRNNSHVAVLKQTLELQKQAEVAKVSAELSSQVKHIQILEKTIERVANDLNEQRKLTKDVALASAKSMYVPQQMHQVSGNNSR